MWNQVKGNRVKRLSHERGNNKAIASMRHIESRFVGAAPITTGCPVTELFGQPNKDALTINCPHCGKSINIKVDD